MMLTVPACSVGLLFIVIQIIITDQEYKEQYRSRSTLNTFLGKGWSHFLISWRRKEIIYLPPDPIKFYIGHVDAALEEMAHIIRQRLYQLATNIENNRTSNLLDDLEKTVTMVVDLSQLVSVDVSLDYLEQAISLIINDLDIESTVVHCTPEVTQHQRGRPAFIIPEDTLIYLLDANFKVQNIADLLGVSKRTIERRLQFLGLGITRTYSPCSDEELVIKVAQIVAEYPGVGYRTVKSILKTEGLRVQELRVREAMQVVDPEGVLFRRLFLSACRIRRRTYHVSGPQVLWHMDGNHKLIRWRFVIHGCIDGYSRLPVFLKINTSNKAELVLEAFMEAVAEYGLPHKVRSDKGGENVKVAEFMVSRRGPKSFIAGRSVHNQRIERLWREIWCGVSSLYYNLFCTMEENGILQTDNEAHLAALHLVFKPKIQKHLDQFCHALSHRPLRTEGNRTPMQLWLSGQSRNAVEEIDTTTFGIDYDGPTNLSVDFVEVPDTNFTLPPQALELLERSETEAFGIDTFVELTNLFQL